MGAPNASRTKIQLTCHTLSIKVSYLHDLVLITLSREPLNFTKAEPKAVMFVFSPSLFVLIALILVFLFMAHGYGMRPLGYPPGENHVLLEIGPSRRRTQVV